MSIFLENFIYFIVAFALVFLGYSLLLKKKYQKKNEEFISSEIKYFTKKFKLNIKKINKKTLILLIKFNNSFIVSFTSVVIFNVKGLVWKILIGISLIFVLIYSIYEIEGRILKKKEKKDEL